MTDADRPELVVRILPNVSGLDKQFDYVVPDALGGRVSLGSIVRVDLHGRRVSGWVIELDPADAHADVELLPIRSVTGRGPSRSIIELAGWASVRWAGRLRHFLVAGSPARAVAGIPESGASGVMVEPRSPASTALLDRGGGVLRLPPTSDPMPAVLSAAAFGPTLVVVPSVDAAVILGARLRRSGLRVAMLPDDWAAAAGGIDIVIGARTAAWAPCGGMAAAVLLDEHDESLQEEGSPTWHARDVLLERCRRADVPLLMVSPSPTLTALESGELVRPPHDRERSGWPIVEVVDRRDEVPWKRSLLTSALIEQLRDPDRVVVCISNTTGRARLLACRQCRELTRCERCEAAVILDDDRQLVCLRCDTVRPPVCIACGAGSFANLRPGVTRLREELEAAAGRPAVLVTGAGPAAIESAGVYVGTEAAVHRVEHADTVAFLDFDRELLAPRYRAGEQAMALLVRAARLVGPRARGGRVMIQTFLPDHDVVVAAASSDPGLATAAQRDQRSMLGLPPFGAYAEVGGGGAAEFVASIAPSVEVVFAEADDLIVARADDWMTLGRALNSGVRPPKSRLRIAVDPPR